MKRRMTKKRVIVLALAVIFSLAVSMPASAIDAISLSILDDYLPPEIIETMPYERRVEVAQALRSDPSTVSISTDHIYLDENGELMEINDRQIGYVTGELSYSLVSVNHSGQSGYSPTHYNISISYSWLYYSFLNSTTTYDVIAVWWNPNNQNYTVSVPENGVGGVSSYYSGSGGNWGNSTGIYVMDCCTSISDFTRYFAYKFPQAHLYGTNRSGIMNFALINNTAPQGRELKVNSAYGFRNQEGSIIESESDWIRWNSTDIFNQNFFVRTRTNVGSATIYY